MTIEEFERAIMAGLLAGDDPLLKTLREQYAVAAVRDREMAATGFVTRFEVPSSVAAIDRKLLHLDDLQVELEGVRAPADTSVHVHNGRLRSLECFVYDGTFPAAPSIKAAWYYGTEKHAGITPELMAERDVEELLEEE
ncbi:MAG TPA: hypothetical protein VF432_25250 [Thermoanaerobaculia bacterium]